MPKTEKKSNRPTLSLVSLLGSPVHAPQMMSTAGGQICQLQFLGKKILELAKVSISNQNSQQKNNN